MATKANIPAISPSVHDVFADGSAVPQRKLGTRTTYAYHALEVPCYGPSKPSSRWRDTTRKTIYAVHNELGSSDYVERLFCLGVI